MEARDDINRLVKMAWNLRSNKQKAPMLLEELGDDELSGDTKMPGLDSPLIRPYAQLPNGVQQHTYDYNNSVNGVPISTNSSGGPAEYQGWNNPYPAMAGALASFPAAAAASVPAVLASGLNTEKEKDRQARVSKEQEDAARREEEYWKDVRELGIGVAEDKWHGGLRQAYPEMWLLGAKGLSNALAPSWRLFTGRAANNLVTRYTGSRLAGKGAQWAWNVAPATANAYAAWRNFGTKLPEYKDRNFIDRNIDKFSYWPSIGGWLSYAAGRSAAPILSEFPELMLAGAYGLEETARKAKENYDHNKKVGLIQPANRGFGRGLVDGFKETGSDSYKTGAKHAYQRAKRYYDGMSEDEKREFLREYFNLDYDKAVAAGRKAVNTGEDLLRAFQSLPEEERKAALGLISATPYAVGVARDDINDMRGMASSTNNMEKARLARDIILRTATAGNVVSPVVKDVMKVVDNRMSAPRVPSQ